MVLSPDDSHGLCLAIGTYGDNGHPRLETKLWRCPCSETMRICLNPMTEFVYAYLAVFSFSFKEIRYVKKRQVYIKHNVVKYIINRMLHNASYIILHKLHHVAPMKHKAKVPNYGFVIKLPDRCHQVSSSQEHVPTLSDMLLQPLHCPHSTNTDHARTQRDTKIHKREHIHTHTHILTWANHLCIEVTAWTSKGGILSCRTLMFGQSIL